MRITNVRGIAVDSNLIVKVETDEGLYGIGEAGMAPQIPATQKVLAYFAEWLAGRDPDDIEGLWQELFRYTRRKEGIILSSAVSGIDTALWDIKGKALGVPVWRILGGRARSRVPLYAHVGGASPEATAERAATLAEQGYTVVRLGFDDPRSDGGASFDAGRAVRHSVRTAEAVRKSVGPDVEICMDVHQRLSPVRGIELCEALHQVGMLFVEDPIRSEDPAAYRRLRRTNVPIATGELLYSKWQFRPIVEEDLADYLRIDIAVVGGLTEARKIAAMGEAHYIDVAPHCARGPLLEQATLHLSFAIPNLAVQEHTGGPAWWEEVLPGLVPLGGGFADPPSAPGLGVELDESAAAKHPFVQREMPRWRKPDGSVQDW